MSTSYNSTISTIISSSSSFTTTTSCSCSMEVITPILMATVSVLVDAICFLPDLVKDRLVCQLLLWLTCSLQLATTTTATSNNDGDEQKDKIHLLLLQLVNFVFFCSIVSIVYRIRDIQNRWKRQRPRPPPTGSSTYHPNNNPKDASKYLAPSAWVCLLYNSTILCVLVDHTPKHNNSKDEGDDWTILYKHTVILFGVRFCGQWIIRQYLERQERLQQSLVGLPTTTTTTAATNQLYDRTTSTDLDESRWYEWSPYQVLHWISCILNQNTSTAFTHNTIHSTTQQQQQQQQQQEGWSSSAMICSMLVTEQISGIALKGLTVNDLRSMGISYGPARYLEETIHTRLVDRYPPNNNDHSIHRNYDDNGDNTESHNYYRGTQDDPYWETDNTTSSLYHAQNSQPKSFQTTHPHDNNNNQDNDAFMIDDGTATRAQDLMKEKFGLELPSFRHPSSHHNDDDAPHSHKNDHDDEEEQQFRTPQASIATTIRSGVENHAEPTAVLATAGAATTATAMAGIPLSMLEAMPPRIRQVAARNPELVRKLLSARVAQSQQQQQQQQLQMVSEEQEQIDEHGEDGDSDGENVFLLQKSPSTAVRRRQQQQRS